MIFIHSTIESRFCHSDNIDTSGMSIRFKLSEISEWVSASSISDVPKNAKWLNMSYTRLTRLPDRFRFPEGLMVLHMSDNQFTQLPDRFRFPEGLIKLNMSSNRLTQLPDGFRFPEGLIKLYISDNRLAQLPLDLSTSLDTLNHSTAPTPERVSYSSTSLRSSALSAVRTFRLAGHFKRIDDPTLYLPQDLFDNLNELEQCPKCGSYKELKNIRNIPLPLIPSQLVPRRTCC